MAEGENSVVVDTLYVVGEQEAITATCVVSPAVEDQFTLSWVNEGRYQHYNTYT